MAMKQDQRFARFAALIGEEQLDKLARCRVAVCGVGGVGSYAAEALARSGIGDLTLIDDDVIALHNVNRQLHAATSTLGRMKVEVMAARLRDINPNCIVTTYRERIVPDNVQLLLGVQDFVADAIDDVPAKLALIQYCRQQKIPLLCAMGTGNKLDPTQLEIDDISQTSVCPLCRSVRRRLYREGIRDGVTVVYSREQPRITEIEEDGRHVPASSPWVPPAAGLLMAAYIVRNLCQLDKPLQP